MHKTIYDMDWESLLPGPLKKDRRVYAMAKAIAEQKRKIAAEIWRVKIWENIDRLPEEILDILAHDFKIDWYDYDYPAEIKRDLLKSNYYVHKHLGTKSAVETAISGIYKDTGVEEWWEYGAEPYHFRLLIDATYEDADPVLHKKIIDRVEYYKNARSCLDGVEYIAQPDGMATAYMGVTSTGISMQMTKEVKLYGMG